MVGDETDERLPCEQKSELNRFVWKSLQQIAMKGDGCGDDASVASSVDCELVRDEVSFGYGGYDLSLSRHVERACDATTAETVCVSLPDSCASTEDDVADDLWAVEREVARECVAELFCVVLCERLMSLDENRRNSGDD